MEYNFYSSLNPVVSEPAVKEDEIKIGVVTNCDKLNIRMTPNINSNVICVVDKGSELMINVGESTKDWYNVCNSAGISGFCMKKFVEVEE